jgi:hypothetical protein
MWSENTFEMTCNDRNSITGVSKDFIATPLPIREKVVKRVTIGYDKDNHANFIIDAKGEIIKAMIRAIGVPALLILAWPI